MHEINFANHSDRYLSLLDIVSMQRDSREVFRNRDLQFLINVLYWRIHYNFINNSMIRNAISTENGEFEPNYYANLLLLMHSYHSSSVTIRSIYAVGVRLALL